MINIRIGGEIDLGDFGFVGIHQAIYDASEESRLYMAARFWSDFSRANVILSKSTFQRKTTPVKSSRKSLP
jgi:hypothetical protein